MAPLWLAGADVGAKVTKEAPKSFWRSLSGRSATAYQGSHTVRELRIGDDVEESAASILAAATVRSGQRTLLVHVAEDCVVVGGRQGYAQLGVIEIAAHSPG